MSRRDWIKDHRESIDACVRKHYGVSINSDAEREEWVMNDEGLYNWARSEGANF